MSETMISAITDILEVISLVCITYILILLYRSRQ